MRSFEDLAVGEVTDGGQVTLWVAEIHGFAGRFDPQPLPADPEAADDYVGTRRPDPDGELLTA